MADVYTEIFSSRVMMRSSCWRFLDAGYGFHEDGLKVLHSILRKCFLHGIDFSAASPSVACIDSYTILGLREFLSTTVDGLGA